jgi:hypothetical protein
MLTGFIWQALVNIVMNIQISWKKQNMSTYIATVSLSRRTIIHGVRVVLEKEIVWVQKVKEVKLPL